MPNKGFLQILGPLEAEILPLIWDDGCRTVKEVHGQIAQRRAIAYTTVMTTMERLVMKGILHRERIGLAYRYTPLIDRRSFALQAVRQVVDEVLDGDAAVLIAELRRRSSTRA